jgi:hypothetical protein
MRDYFNELYEWDEAASTLSGLTFGSRRWTRRARSPTRLIARSASDCITQRGTAMCSPHMSIVGQEGMP